MLACKPEGGDRGYGEKAEWMELHLHGHAFPNDQSEEEKEKRGKQRMRDNNLSEHGAILHFERLPLVADYDPSILLFPELHSIID